MNKNNRVGAMPQPLFVRQQQQHPGSSSVSDDVQQQQLPGLQDYNNMDVFSRMNNVHIQITYQKETETYPLSMEAIIGTKPSLFAMDVVLMLFEVIHPLVYE